MGLPQLSNDWTSSQGFSWANPTGSNLFAADAGAQPLAAFGGAGIQGVPGFDWNQSSAGFGPTAIPDTGAGGGWMQSLKNGLSQPGGLSGIASGIGALTQAYLGFQQLKQAKEGLALQKEGFNANLNNSIKTYNNSLEDRINGRTSAHAGKDGEVAAYLAKHSLSR